MWCIAINSLIERTAKNAGSDVKANIRPGVEKLVLAWIVEEAPLLSMVLASAVQCSELEDVSLEMGHLEMSPY